MEKLQPYDAKDLEQVVTRALAEDIGKGDITSDLVIPASATATMHFIAAETLVACGTFVPQAVYRQLGGVEITVHAAEGQLCKPETKLLTAVGSAKILLTGERTCLNLMQRLSGVATLTHHYVQAVKGTKAVILDTRKTMPGLRLLDKYAVRAGGGQNHRMRLDDMVLIKDNHIAMTGSIAEAVKKARAATELSIEVECDTLAQAEEAVKSGADRILLDNMNVDDIKKAVLMAAGKTAIEASGGITLETVKKIAAAGVDYISVGRITHSAPAADIRADIVIN